MHPPKLRIAVVGNEEQLRWLITDGGHRPGHKYMEGLNVCLPPLYQFGRLTLADWDAIIVFASAFDDPIAFIRQLMGFAHLNDPQGLEAHLVALVPTFLESRKKKMAELKQLGVNSILLYSVGMSPQESCRLMDRIMGAINTHTPL